MQRRQRRQRHRHLGDLRSVSAAYRRSALLNVAQENDLNGHRPSPQELARDPSQSSYSAVPGAGGSSAIIRGSGTFAFRGNTITNTVPASIAFQQQYQARQAALISLAASAPTAARPPDKIITTTVKHGEIVGWRSWRVDSRGAPKLRSMFADMTWTPGVAMRGEVRTGVYGVHAWKTRDQAEAYAPSYNCVIGEVELWGEVHEHADGYRAEYAAIKSLYRPANSARSTLDILALRQEYLGREHNSPTEAQDESDARLARGFKRGALLGLLACLFLALSLLPYPVMRGAAIYAIGGFITLGLVYADFARQFPSTARDNHIENTAFSIFMGILWPVALPVIALVSGGYPHGWLWPWSSKFK